MAFIGVPLSVSLYRSQKRKFAERHGLLVNPLQKMVYDQRVAVRNSLRSDDKSS